MNKRKNLSQLLNDVAGVVPDAGATAHALERARSSISASPQLSLRAQLMRPRNIAAIAAAIAIIVVLSQLLPSGGSNFAFGQVKEEVAKTKSVQFVATCTWKGHPVGVPYEFEEVRHVQILDSGFKKEEVRVKSFHWQGTEIPIDADNTNFVSIFNSNRKEYLSLSPGTKEFVRGSFSGSLSDESYLLHPVMRWQDPAAMRLSWQYGRYKFGPELDIYQLIQRIPEGRAKKLPEKNLNGKSVAGFVVEQPVPIDAPDARKEDVAALTHTWWVDSETYLPVQLEIAYKSTYANSQNHTWTVTDIAFNAPLDSTQFALDPPGNYREVHSFAVEKPVSEESVNSRYKKTEFVFAEVKKEVARTKTVQYDEKILSVLEDGATLQSEKRVAILDNHLKREEQTLTVIGKDGKEDPERSHRSIQVFDAQSQKLLFMLPEKKEYFTKDYSQPANGNSFKPAITATLFLQGGFYDLIRDVPADKAKQLPEKQIAGKAAIGFLVEESLKTPVGVNTWQRTYWIDPKTKFPLQIEVKFRTEGSEEPKAEAASQPSGSMDDTIRNIKFDVQLDPKIFSMEPPAGYTDIAAKKSDANAKPNEK